MLICPAGYSVLSDEYALYKLTFSCHDFWRHLTISKYNTNFMVVGVAVFNKPSALILLHTVQRKAAMSGYFWILRESSTHMFLYRD